MKIYTEVVYTWDEAKGELVEESSKSFDYEGPMTLCHDKFEYIGPKRFNNKVRIAHTHSFDKPDEGTSEAEQAAAADAALQVRKDDAKTDLLDAFSGYGLEDKDSPYFKDIARRYTNFAMNAPVTGIKDQRGDAMKELIAQLARQGKLDSTVRTDREALAKKLYAKGQVDAALKGRGIGEGVRQTLSDAKTQGLADIDAATDPESTAQSHMSGIMAKTDPGTFDPVLDVFLKLTQGLAMRQEVERRRDRQAEINSYLAGDRSKLIT